jgi:hypothetical protein
LASPNRILDFIEKIVELAISKIKFNKRYFIMIEIEFLENPQLGMFEMILMKFSKINRLGCFSGCSGPTQETLAGGTDR